MNGMCEFGGTEALSDLISDFRNGSPARIAECFLPFREESQASQRPINTQESDVEQGAFDCLEEFGRSRTKDGRSTLRGGLLRGEEEVLGNLPLGTLPR